MHVLTRSVICCTAALFLGSAGCESAPGDANKSLGARGGSGGTTAVVMSTSTGTGGAGGAPSTSTSTSTATGTGGTCGGSSICTTVIDCPLPANACITATCTAGVCGTASVPAGTATMAQAPGDCLRNECSGNGAILVMNDDTDLKDDNNPCTIDACSAGAATHLPVAAGVTCGVGQFCNAVGSCVGCIVASTCPGQDDECKARSCNANVCGFSFKAVGTMTTAQTVGDCKKNQCDGAGAIVPVSEDTDLPSDAVQCTSDVCSAGVPSNPPLAAGSACNEAGGTTCDGGGHCVQCVTASTCPGQDTSCQTRTCTAGVCSFSFAASGTATTNQVANDCQKNTCNGGRRPFRG